jgi:hypothetical protein
MPLIRNNTNASLLSEDIASDAFSGHTLPG